MPRAIVFEREELLNLGELPFGLGCDFCATGTPVYRYPVRSTGLGVIIYGPTVLRPVSVGYWGACAECGDLIEAGDWPALARHSLRSLNLDFLMQDRACGCAFWHRSAQRMRRSNAPGPVRGNAK